MSIQSTGTGSIIFVPVNQRPIPNVDGTPITVNNTAVIDSGPASGEVFAGRANSFLDPNDILATINNFGNSIGKNSGILQNNPNSSEIMNETQAGINEIFSRNFIPETIVLPLLDLPLALPLPDVTNNPTANQINLASLFMSNVILSTIGAGPIGTTPGTGINTGGNGAGTNTGQGTTANTNAANLIQQNTNQFINSLLQQSNPAQNPVAAGDITNGRTDRSTTPFIPTVFNPSGLMQNAFANPINSRSAPTPSTTTSNAFMQNPGLFINGLIQ